MQPCCASVSHAPLAPPPAWSVRKVVLVLSTRHELKEQLRHDPFRDSVSNVVEYTSSHRQTVIMWAGIAIAVLILIGGIVWYRAHERAIHEADLEAAFQVVTAPVGPPNQFTKTYPTEAARRDASIKALSGVVAKDGGSREGLIARYYLGTLKLQNGDPSGGENDLKAVANSRTDTAALAKIALANFYAGQNRTADARNLLEEIVNKPNDLVSKEQAQILLARLDATTNPAQARKLLTPLKASKDQIVARAADQVSTEIAK